jgi:molybdate transport system substrate-binding protein
LVVVTCALDAPCGRYAAEVFRAAGVEVLPKSLEANVKAVVSKVVLGEADAGVVYVSDVIAAGSDASGVPIPPTINVIATYPITVTKDAPHAADAQAFVDFVLSGQGQQILRSFGFGGP